MLSKIKNKIVEMKDALVMQISRVFNIPQLVSISRMTIAPVAAMSMCIIPAFAISPSEIIGTIIGYVCSIFMWIGVVLMVWAIGQLVLAFKNEDADSKSRAVMIIVVSVILISMKTIITGVLGMLTDADDSGINGSSIIDSMSHAQW